MPVLGVPPEPKPVPDPVPVPWSWTVADLGAHLTASQRKSLLARFRALGYKDAKEWVT